MTRIKNLITNAIIPVKGENYLILLVFIAPLLNFLAGITFDLHAPSLPSIATYFSAPISAAKNTITVSLLGFSIGCIVFGILLDTFGRRPIILLGLLLYTAASFLALACTTINELLLVRFAQGFAVSCISIGCRTIIIDNFTGHQFKVVLLYTSLAFGIGPIIAPFIGGLLQYYFGWQANFIAYGVVSFILMIITLLYISESYKKESTYSYKNLLLNFLNVLRHPAFSSGVIISGISQVQLLIYTVTGAFLIENVLHRTAITYGNSALIISCGYLLGTITNRLFIKYFSTFYLISFGFILLFFSILIQIIFSIFGEFNLFTLIFPIFLIGFSNGFIFINVFSVCLKLSPSAGIATALFTSAVMLAGTLGIGIISYLNIHNLSYLAATFGVSAIIQLTIFILFFKNIAKKSL